MGSASTTSCCQQHIYIFSSLKYFETAKTYSLDSAMNCVLLLPILVFAVLISSADAARFPHFFVIWSSGNLWKKESFANFSAYQNFICEWMVNFFRAPEPGFLNAFQQPASVFRARRQQQQQSGVLGCLTPCTRELRPVRGHQGGREKILPNPCTFQAAQCQARRTRFDLFDDDDDDDDDDADDGGV